MAKFLPFGKDPVDLLVADFLKAKGIDPNDITGYRLSRGVDTFGTLTIDMPFEHIAPDDRPEQEG